MTGPSVVLLARFDDAEHAHARHRARALQRLGCDVTTVELSRRPGLLGRLTGGDLRARLRKEIEQAEAQLVLAVGGYELQDGLIESLRDLAGVRWAHYLPDDLTLIDDAVRVARPFERIFAAGTDVAQRLESALGRPVTVLPLAADPSVYRPSRSKDQYRANVVFAGRATPAREAYLSALVEFGLALWGPGWRRTSLKDYCRGELASTAEYVRAYGGASVAVNLHRDLPSVAADCRAICNQRVFELAAMGVPQVVDERRDLPTYFEPGRELVTFRSPEVLRGAVEDLLHHPPRAEEMASRARARALSQHTHMHRMRIILETVGLAAAA
jgi:spore maturation protein CgeB